MQLWDKGKPILKPILDFTVGKDYQLDLRLVRYDCIASQAHTKMLQKIGALTEKEAEMITAGLSEILDRTGKNEFTITKEQEDCHTAIEEFLTDKYGDVGKKIHLGRSRNDQILTALRLYEKDILSDTEISLKGFQKALTEVARKFGKTIIPGYTHMRKAMPTSVRIWIESFHSAVRDDLMLLATLRKIIDQSPLGTAAGFGVPIFKLDREMTSEIMNFARVQKNPLYAQFSRGKFEMSIMAFLTGIMLIMNKLASDLMLFSMDEFGFIVLPDALCTGSSMMPQKKNPDVLEIIRANYSMILGEEFKVKSLVSNLISGYNRDLQLIKEPLFHSFDTTKECIEIMTLVLNQIKVDKRRCTSAVTKDMYATEEVYRLVLEGMPFREAYRKIAAKYSKSDS
jgi:argininosuccinate lyase